MVSTLIGILFTYIFSSLILFLFFSKLLKIKEENLLLLFMLTIGLGPITISWLLAKLVAIFPHHSNEFYIIFILAIFLLILFFSHRNLSYLKSVWRELVSFFASEKDEIGYFMKGVEISVIILLVLIFYFVLLFPIIENDALQYATVARMMYNLKSSVFYPVIHPYPKTGFYAVSCHPLGYISLITWNYMIQGGVNKTWIVRLISPIYMFHTMFLLYYLLCIIKDKKCALIGLFLLITTPVYFRETLNMGIDAFRIYFFFLSFVVLYFLLRDKEITKRSVLLLGYIAGMAAFTHSMGILVPPFLISIYIFLSKDSIKTKIYVCLIIVLLSFFLAGSRYVSNYLTFGFPIYDNLPVYKVSELKRNEWKLISRGLTNLNETILYGLFKGFTRPLSFGINYWPILLAIPLFLRRSKKDPIMVFPYLVIIFYIFLSCLLLVAITTGKFIALEAFASSRYIQTVQPFIACLGGLGVGHLLDKKILKRLKSDFLIGCFLLIALLPSITLFYYKIWVFHSPTGLATEKEDDLLFHSELGMHQLVRYIKWNIKKKSLFLVFNQAGFAFYLPDRKFIRHYDPRLIPFYRIKDKKKAYEFLRNFGVDYIITVPYSLPTYFNSQIYRIVSDPSLSRLLYQGKRGYRIYRLNKIPETIKLKQLKININSKFFVKKYVGIWGPFMFGYHENPQIKKIHKEVELTVQGVDSFWSNTFVYSFEGHLNLPSRCSLSPQQIEPNKRYYFRADISGKGLIRIYVYEYIPGGSLFGSKRVWKANPIPLWSGVINNESKVVEAQFFSQPLARDYRIVFQIKRRGYLTIKNITLKRIIDVDEKNFTILEAWKEDLYKEVPLPIPENMVLRKQDGRRFIYLTPNEKRPVWLIFGPYSGSKNPYVKIKALLKGDGKLSLYFIADLRYRLPEIKQVALYYLPSVYKELDMPTQLPLQTNSIWVLFKLKRYYGKKPESTHMYLERFTITPFNP